MGLHTGRKPIPPPSMPRYANLYRYYSCNHYVCIFLFSHLFNPLASTCPFSILIRLFFTLSSFFPLFSYSPPHPNCISGGGGCFQWLHPWRCFLDILMNFMEHEHYDLNFNQSALWCEYCLCRDYQLSPRSVGAGSVHVYRWEHSLPLPRLM